jgi:SAM-dependent methyltransferase
VPVFKEIGTLVRRSIAEQGMCRTVARCVVVGPVYAWHRLQEIRRRRPTILSDFDRAFGVDTDGAMNDTTHLRDLDIASPNWVHAVDYIPVKPDLFRQALSDIAVPYEKFMFIDFGCGKGRAMLLASELPFQRVVGIDFSHELVAIARANWAVYEKAGRRCHEAEFVCADFVDYRVPPRPAILFFYNPCAAHVLARVAEHIRQDVTKSREPVFVVYVNPLYPDVWATRGFRIISKRRGYEVYTTESTFP